MKLSQNALNVLKKNIGIYIKYSKFDYSIGTVRLAFNDFLVYHKHLTVGLISSFVNELGQIVRLDLLPKCRFEEYLKKYRKLLERFNDLNQNPLDWFKIEFFYEEDIVKKYNSLSTQSSSSEQPHHGSEHLIFQMDP